MYLTLLFITGQQLADSLVRNALSGNRGGSSGGQGGSSGGGGGDGFLSSLRYGGLFNENTGHSASEAKQGDKPRVSGAGPGGVFSIILVTFNHLTKN